MLIAGPVQLRPLACDLEASLTGKPPVTRGVAARASALDGLGGKSLYPPVDGHVIDRDAALGQQLLDVAAGQAVAEVPADGYRGFAPAQRAVPVVADLSEWAPVGA